MRSYVAGHAGGFVAFGYDGDPSGGSHACATLTAVDCDAPPTRTIDARGLPELSCPSSSPARSLCQR